MRCGGISAPTPTAQWSRQCPSSPWDRTRFSSSRWRWRQDSQREGVGSRLLAFAEAWARRGGYGMIILNARMGVEGFYRRHGYRAEGEPFDENTIPHIRMTKRTLGGKRMSLEVGDKAPSFTSARRWRQARSR